MLLSTRKMYGCVIREYLDGDARTVTWEVPASVIKSIGVGRIQRLGMRAQRGAEKRRLAEKRKIEIGDMLRSGMTPTAAAKRAKVSPTYARLIRRAKGLPALRLQSPRASALRDAVAAEFARGLRDTAQISTATTASRSYVCKVIRELKKNAPKIRHDV